jgi:electron transfer flavoprotein alpha subunit
MTALLVAVHDNTELKDATHKAASAAVAIDSDLHVLVAGKGCRSVAEQAAKLSGVSKVLLAEHDALEHRLAEPLAALVVSLAGGYGAIVAPANTTGKNFMPRVAALLDVMQISDIIEVVAPDTFVRPIYAGNAIQTVRSTDDTKLITVRSTAFPAVAEDGSAPVEDVAVPDLPSISEFVGDELTKSDRPELTSARIVISGGRGMGSNENFHKFIEPVADRLGAAVGASRAAVDAGYMSNDHQVGQTGKVVAPELYVAVGISGAIQHLAGMKDSKVIVAINKDEEAPIFQVADYGLVADLFEALPELDEELKKAGH